MTISGWLDEKQAEWAYVSRSVLPDDLSFDKDLERPFIERDPALQNLQL
jgi:hypothetical protein